MYQKTAPLLVACALAAVLAGCKKDALIESVLADLHTFSQEIVRRVEAGPNLSAGIDDAQRYFDSRKAEMEGKLKSIRGIHGFQVSQETQRKMTEQLTEDVMSVSKLQIKYMIETTRDPALRAKLGKLIGDYQSLLKSVGEG